MRTGRSERTTVRGPNAWPAVAVGLVLACAGCWHAGPEPDDDPSRLTMTLRSAAFADGGMIPKQFTCDGADTSPPLEWSGVPQAAQALALICDDPDAPMRTFSHWVVFHVPAGVKGLKPAVPAEADLPPDWLLWTGESSKAAPVQGKNDFGKAGYGGPCPPSGTHRYVFRIYALDSAVGAGSASPTRSDVLEAIKGHVLAEGRLMGKYARSR